MAVGCTHGFANSRLKSRECANHFFEDTKKSLPDCSITVRINLVCTFESQSRRRIHHSFQSMYSSRIREIHVAIITLSCFYLLYVICISNSTLSLTHCLYAWRFFSLIVRAGGLVFPVLYSKV